MSSRRHLRKYKDVCPPPPFEYLDKVNMGGTDDGPTNFYVEEVLNLSGPQGLNAALVRHLGTSTKYPHEGLNSAWLYKTKRLCAVHTTKNAKHSVLPTAGARRRHICIMIMKTIVILV